MKYLSLFSGIGGFELGILQAYENLDNRGTASPPTLAVHGDKPDTDTGDGDGRRTNPTCIGYSEFDPKCQARPNDEECDGYHTSIEKYKSQCEKCGSTKTQYAPIIYDHHFPTHKAYGDITKIKTAELPDFDLLVGGFPCQSFSIAGKRGGFNDTRGTLFFEIARIARDKKPQYLLLENVKGLLSHDRGNTFTTIIRVLTDLGYDVQWSVLNSKNFGVPQNRERVFIAGCLGGWGGREVFSFGESYKEFTKKTGKQGCANTLTGRSESL